MKLAMQTLMMVGSFIFVILIFIFGIAWSFDSGIRAAARAQCAHLEDSVCREECEEDIVAYTYGIK